MFLFKKIVAPFFLPLNFCIEIVLLGLFLSSFTKRQRAGKVLTFSGAILLYLFSFSPFSAFLLGSLESRYSPVAGKEKLYPQAKWIVVLGGGHNTDLRLPDSQRLSLHSLARVVEGVRIYKNVTGSKLIVSGGAVFDSSTNAGLLASAAQMFGVPKEDIVLESKSRDTEEEARYIFPMVKQEPLFLVTSASHMHRSMVLFRNNGMNPIASPTDYMVKDSSRPLYFELIPGIGALNQSDRAVYEYLGLLWNRL